MGRPVAVGGAVNELPNSPFEGVGGLGVEGSVLKRPPPSVAVGFGRKMVLKVNPLVWVAAIGLAFKEPSLVVGAASAALETGADISGRGKAAEGAG